MDLYDKQKFGTGAIGLLIVVIFMSAYAWGDMPSEGKADKESDMKRHPMSPCGIYSEQKMVQGLVQALGLSDEQVKRLRDGIFTVKERHLELRAQLDRLDLQMERAFSAETVDETTVRELAQKIADLDRKMFIQNTEFRLAAEKLLTLDQRKKLRMYELDRRAEQEWEKHRKW
jgi:Spy/CpxP family protein refolding chaperone